MSRIILPGVLVAVAVLGAATQTYASSAAAPLTVSVTVVPSCAIQTGGTASDVSLRCARSVGPVRVSDPQKPLSVQPAPAPASSSGSPAPDTRLITINF